MILSYLLTRSLTFTRSSLLIGLSGSTDIARLCRRYSPYRAPILPLCLLASKARTSCDSPSSKTGEISSRKYFSRDSASSLFMFFEKAWLRRLPSLVTNDLKAFQSSYRASHISADSAFSADSIRSINPLHSSRTKSAVISPGRFGKCLYCIMLFVKRIYLYFAWSAIKI